MRMISFTQTSTKQVEISLEIQMSKSTEKNAELLGLIKIFFSFIVERIHIDRRHFADI
jgi:hypothetical protein